LFLNDNHKLYIQKLFTHTPTHTPDNIRKLSINTQ
jgi:hypothetical protein